MSNVKTSIKSVQSPIQNIQDYHYYPSNSQIKVKNCRKTSRNPIKEETKAKNLSTSETSVKASWND